MPMKTPEFGFELVKRANSKLTFEWWRTILTPPLLLALLSILIYLLLPHCNDFF